ncbi:MAG TPA: SEL1-like repeat protein, partial [Kiloniellales bacterium]|nr:SEL1-like repeat protein [Kiloniellales bacterium]
ADQGHAAAQNELAILHIKGLGVPQDYVAAYVWFALAADSYGIGARRDQALEIRDMMAAFMTPAQLEEARTEVRRRREGSVQ